MKRRSAANSRRMVGRGNIGTWLLQHVQAAVSSLGRCNRHLLSTFMTVAVIGIALALPTALHVLLDNVTRVSNNWDQATTLSLFLKSELAEADAQTLARRLQLHDGIASVHLIPPDEALEEFQRYSGFAGALDALDENPLPAVLVVEPAPAHSSSNRIKILKDELALLDGVDFVQLDMQWVQRFQAITEMAGRGVAVLASLLALAVLLIVGNTIRLEIQNHKPEIEITKLVGGTDAFIRRPFLYSGFWYGLLGGWLAWLLVSLALWLLSEPAAQLTLLYQGQFDLSAVPISTILVLMAGGGLLGLAGSWVAVGRHLNAINPT